MKHMQLPPTRIDVVKETLQRSWLFQKNVCRRALYSHMICLQQKQRKEFSVKINHNLIMFFSSLVLFILKCHSSYPQEKLLRTPKNRINFQKVLSFFSWFHEKISKRKILKQMLPWTYLLSPKSHGLHVEQFFQYNDFL